MNNRLSQISFRRKLLTYLSHQSIFDFLIMQDLIALLQSAENVADAHSDSFSPLDLEPLPIGPNVQVVSQLPALNFAEIFTRRVSYNTFEAPLLPELSDGAITLSDDSDRSPICTPAPFSGVTVSPSPSASSLVAAKPSTVASSSLEDKLDMKRYRGYQPGQWNERFPELMQFREEHGHLFVPHSYPKNQKVCCTES